MRSLSVRQLVTLATILLILAYLGYGISTGTGLAGYVQDLEMRWFGSAPDGMTVFLLAIAFVPVALLLNLASRVFPNSFLGRLVAEERAAPMFVRPTEEDQLARIRMLRWVAVALVILPWTVGYLAYWWIASEHQAEHGTRPEAIQLAVGHPAPSPHGKFVTINGVAQPKLTLAVDERRYDQVTKTDYYVPLTPRDWEGRDEVRYVVHFQTREGDRVEPNVNQPFDGRVVAKNGLPAYVARRYGEIGMRLASTYYVLEPVVLQTGAVADRSAEDRETFLMYATLASITGAAMLLASFVAKQIGRWRATR
jgi:hypothetical protein